MEDKDQILTSILETIECISNKEYQKRIWIRAEGPECDDFSETANNFFGICNMDLLGSPKHVVI